MVTLDQIAQEAGVTRQTVANVLNGRNKENWGSTARRATQIREVALRLGYQPNVMARAVATGKSRVVGLVLQNNRAGSDAEVQNGLLQELTLQNYTTKLLYLPYPPTVEDFSNVAQQCAMWKLEGLIVVSLQESSMSIFEEQLSQVDCPVAFVGGVPPKNSLGVFSDSYTAVRLGLEHLASLGHRRIAFLGGTNDSSVTSQEVASFKKVMGELGLPCGENSVALSDWGNAEIIAAATTRLLQLPDPPTAIFCNSTTQALIAVSTARKLGLQVPQQLSLLCYGSSQLAAHTDPPLTSLIQPSKNMGRIAVQQLLAFIQNQAPDSPRHPLRLKEGIHLVVRGSTVPPESNE